MKIKNRKIRTAYLLFLFVLVSLAGGLAPKEAAAAETVNFTVSAGADTLHRGDTVTYTVEMTGNESIQGLVLNLEYDSSVLELMEYTKGTVFDHLGDFGMGALTTVEMETGVPVVRATIVSENILGDGVVFTAEFAVKEDAQPGAVNVRILENDADTNGNLQTSDENYNSVETRVTNNAASVVEGDDTDESETPDDTTELDDTTEPDDTKEPGDTTNASAPNGADASAEKATAETETAVSVSPETADLNHPGLGVLTLLCGCAAVAYSVKKWFSKAKC